MKTIKPAILIILLSACGDKSESLKIPKYVAPAPGTVGYAPIECKNICAPNPIKRYECNWAGSLSVCECWDGKEKK